MVRKYPMIAGIALLLSWAIASPTPAKAAGELRQALIAKLEAAKEALKIEGNLKPLYPPTVGQLTLGASAPYTIQLNAGTEYTFVGLCDGNCHDIDLRVTDMNGNEIAVDNKSDDYPLIAFMPSSSRKVQVNAIMNDCSANFCYFGLGVFSK